MVASSNRVTHDSGELPAVGAYRRLSLRVINQALRDVVATSGSPTHRQSARIFLAGSPMLDLWCQVAELDPARVVAYAGTLEHSQSAFGRTASVGQSLTVRAIRCTR